RSRAGRDLSARSRMRLSTPMDCSFKGSHLSKGGGTNSTIDPRVFDLFNAKFKHAQTNANQPFNPYTDSVVASPSAATQQGWNTILGGAMDAGKGALDNAVNAAQGVAGLKPESITAPAVTAALASPAAINRGDIANVAATSGLAGLQGYLNPY